MQAILRKKIAFIIVFCLTVITGTVIYFLFKTRSSNHIDLLAFSGKCGETLIEDRKAKIYREEVRARTLVIEIRAAATCCMDFRGDLEVDNDVINLKYEQYGRACNCICESTLVYTLGSSIDKDFSTKGYIFKLNGEVLEYWES